jgi:hypothetical protein
VIQGEEIKGTLTCAPNARNNRDLDITIQAGDMKMDYKMCVFLLLVLSTLNGRIGHDRLFFV